MKNDPLVVLVPLSRPASLSFTELQTQFSLLGGEPDLVLSQSAGQVTTFHVGAAIASLAVVPQPISWKMLAGPAAAAWYWPDAVATLKTHQTHLLLTFVPEDISPLEAFLTLTRLTAAVVQASPAGGVVWGPSGKVHEPSAFYQLAQSGTREDLPLHAWIDFRIEQLGSTTRLFTTGMVRLGKKEIEFAINDRPQQQLLDDAYNVAHYVLDQPVDFGDGETMGLPDGSQVTLQNCPSMLDDRLQVYLLTYA